MSLEAFIILVCFLATVGMLAAYYGVSAILRWWDGREQARVDALIDPEGGES